MHVIVTCFEVRTCLAVSGVLKDFLQKRDSQPSESNALWLDGHKSEVVKWGSTIVLCQCMYSARVASSSSSTWPPLNCECGKMQLLPYLDTNGRDWKRPRKNLRIVSQLKFEPGTSRILDRIVACFRFRCLAHDSNTWPSASDRNVMDINATPMLQHVS